MNKNVADASCTLTVHA